MLSPPNGLSVTASSGPTVARPPRFLTICQSGGRGTAGNAADDHFVIQHAFVNGITLVSWNDCFGAMRSIPFVTRILDRIWRVFLYVELPLVTNFISIPVVFNIYGFYCILYLLKKCIIRGVSSSD